MRRLFILRPEPGAAGTLNRAKARGLDAVRMPLFKVEALAWDAPEAAGFDALLLTSANAVIYGGEPLQKLRALPVHAVGEATADTARQAGFVIASRGDGGVNRLLGSLEAGLRLLHLCGESRRDPQEPRQKIEAIAVYRSVALDPPGDLKSLEGQTASVYSPRAAERLAELAAQCGLARDRVRLACISEAAVDAAGDGWAVKEAAGQPTDDALLALAARLCDIEARR